MAIDLEQIGDQLVRAVIATHRLGNKGIANVYDKAVTETSSVESQFVRDVLNKMSPTDLYDRYPWLRECEKELVKMMGAAL